MQTSVEEATERLDRDLGFCGDLCPGLILNVTGDRQVLKGELWSASNGLFCQEAFRVFMQEALEQGGGGERFWATSGLLLQEAAIEIVQAGQGDFPSAIGLPSGVLELITHQVIDPGHNGMLGSVVINMLANVEAGFLQGLAVQFSIGRAGPAPTLGVGNFAGGPNAFHQPCQGELALGALGRMALCGQSELLKPLIEGLCHGMKERNASVDRSKSRVLIVSMAEAYKVTQTELQKYFERLFA